LWLDRHRSGALTAQLNEQIFLIQDGVGEKMSFIVRALSIFVSNMVVTLSIDWRMAVLLSPVSAAACLLMSYSERLISASSARHTRETEPAGTVLAEALMNVKTVQSCNGQAAMVGRYEAILRGGRVHAILQYVWCGLFDGLFIFVLYIGLAVGAM
jgi:ABC-type multidrug transport system fused ATPase/permease subunit